MAGREDNGKRKRFHKPCHFSNKVRNHPMQCLGEIFQTFHLNDFRDEINKWQQLALANDQSVYDEGDAREDLIDFCHEFLRVIEALHVLNETKSKKHKNKWKKNLSNEAKKIMGKMNQPVLLNEEEKVNPQLVIKRFCNGFSYSYAKIEISDLLEAVITYEGEKKVYKGNLILFYLCMKCLLRVAYTICKNKN